MSHEILIGSQVMTSPGGPQADLDVVQEDRSAELKLQAKI